MKHEIILAVIVREGEILLGHRTPLRDWYANCWDLIGGHIEAGETPEEALRRECREEVGIEITRAHAVAVELSDPQIKPHAFVVSQWEGEIRNMAPEEHDELSWVRPAELPGLTLADPVYLSWLPGLCPGHP